MKTDQKSCFSQTYYKRTVSLLEDRQFNQDTKQNYIWLLLPLSFRVQVKVLQGFPWNIVQVNAKALL